MSQLSPLPQLGRNPRLLPVSTDQAAAPAGPYSQAIAANGLLFLSGQRPVDSESGAIPEGVEAQSHAVLRNVVNVLQAGGSALDRVVKVTAHLADLKDFDEFNAVYKLYFSPPYPARTTVGSQLRGILVELDAIALCDVQPAEGGAATVRISGADLLARIPQARQVASFPYGRLEHLARGHGLAVLRLDTRHDLVEARRLYATLGYEEVHAFNDGRYAEHWLAKPLA